jgi:hypothetical protein
LAGTVAGAAIFGAATAATLGLVAAGLGAT